MQYCCETLVSIVGTGEMAFISAIDESLVSTSIDTIDGSPFRIRTDYEVDFVDNYKQPALINSAYGFGCARVLQNSLVDSTFTLICDKDIIHNGMTVAAGQELRNLTGLVTSRGGAYTQISFSEETRAATEFTPTAHTFTLSIDTSDGLTLVSEGTLVFRS